MKWGGWSGFNGVGESLLRIHSFPSNNNFHFYSRAPHRIDDDHEKWASASLQQCQNPRFIVGLFSLVSGAFFFVFVGPFLASFSSFFRAGLTPKRLLTLLIKFYDYFFFHGSDPGDHKAAAGPFVSSRSTRRLPAGCHSNGVGGLRWFN